MPAAAIITLVAAAVVAWFYPGDDATGADPSFGAADEDTSVAPRQTALDHPDPEAVALELPTRGISERQRMAQAEPRVAPSASAPGGEPEVWIVVTHRSQGVPSARVRLFTEDGSWSATTDEKGGATLPRPSSTKGSLQVEAEGFATYRSRLRDDPLASGVRSGHARIELAAGGSVIVVVQDAASGAPLPFHPVDLYLDLADGSKSRAVAEHLMAITDHLGRARVDGLAVGEWEGKAYEWRGYAPSPSRRFEVVAGPLAHVLLRMSKEPLVGRIRFAVRSPSDAEFDTARVCTNYRFVRRVAEGAPVHRHPLFQNPDGTLEGITRTGDHEAVWIAMEDKRSEARGEWVEVLTGRDLGYIVLPLSGVTGR